MVSGFLLCVAISLSSCPASGGLRRHCMLRVVLASAAIDCKQMVNDCAVDALAMAERAHVSGTRDCFDHSWLADARELLRHQLSRPRRMFAPHQEHRDSQAAIRLKRDALLDQSAKFEGSFGNPMREIVLSFGFQSVPGARAAPVVHETTSCGPVSASRDAPRDLRCKRPNFAQCVPAVRSCRL